MRRPAHAEDTLQRIQGWRRECPELTLRSTFIVGFPGESAADFELLLSWLEAAQLDRVGCFKYSPVSGARANALDGAVPEEIKEQRYARFMERAAAVSRARLARRVGQRLQVLVDRVADGIAYARSAGDAPDIDGVVRLKASAATRPGEFVQATITAAGTYDLEGRL
jgi:ribosomal protein S12 methylthiotransferase